jgi:hypothetical protein
MFLDPVSLGLGVAQAGFGILQGQLANKAAQQDYLNQAAFAKANTAFAKWQAGLNARIGDANNQYQYWQQTVNYNQELAYTKSLRNFELSKAITQAKAVGEARVNAGANFIQQSDALNQQMQEKGLQDAVALQQYRMQVLRSSKAVQAMSMEGRSVDRLVNDFARQEGDYATLQDINQKLYSRQMTREKAQAVTLYLQNYNSQQFYTEQKYLDPNMPFAPLPTLIQPPPPSMAGGSPMNTSALSIGTGLLSGVNTYFSSYSDLAKYRGVGGGGSSMSIAPSGGNTSLAFSGINLMGN